MLTLLCVLFVFIGLGCGALLFAGLIADYAARRVKQEPDEDLWWDQ